MGQEITHSHFKKNDFEQYRHKLDAELDWIKTWFNEVDTPEDNLSQVSIGFEMELCLLDKKGEPANCNEAFLQALKNTDIAAQISLELAKFNVELNSLVFKVKHHILSQLQQELERLWTVCTEIAKKIDCLLLMIGILPSLREDHLKLDNMSLVTRYKALNEQVLRSRKGRAIELDIQGSETLKSIHHDVMLESAATSFQLHLQMPFSRSVRYYNAAIILSAPMVAISANSPFLFGKELWCETRIPVFEQAISIGGFEGAMFGPIKRVSFGSGYAKDSLLECFEENNEHYPILLAEVFDSDIKELAHLNLHNGTIWRWNRPIIYQQGAAKKSSADKTMTQKNNSDNKVPDYHVRLENRVIPAGPTVVDSIANAAFFYGAITALANQYEIPEQTLSFVQAKENFYHAAKHGLKGKLLGLSGQSLPTKALILDYILPMAKDGLVQMGVMRRDIDYYLGIIEQRTKIGQNGAYWQRAFAHKYGKDMQKLTLAYYNHQKTGQPVHEWTI